MNVPKAQPPHIKTRTAIEICVESIEFALAAQRAEADRIELCTRLSCGGLTPSHEMLREARAALDLPIHVLIRPREGDFQYSAAEFETMKRDILFAKESAMDGVVAGVLDPGGRVDRERTRELVELAAPLPFTFHRAFDDCVNLEAALADVIATGAKRVLTSGGKCRVSDALSEIVRLMEIAGDRIVVMPGGGIRPENIEQVLRATAAGEIHSSLGESEKNSPSGQNGQTLGINFEVKVRELRDKIQRFDAQATCGQTI